MPRALPKYVYMERTRHGKVLFYFRIGKGKRIRMPNPADADFIEAYKAAITDQPKLEKKTYGVQSLTFLIREYRLSGDFLTLSKTTRYQRDRIYIAIEETAGNKPYRAITRQTILDGKERRMATPNQARMFLDAMRGLFRWALSRGMINSDPTDGVDNPKRKKNGGFPVWSEQDVAQYEEYWPEGSKERVWLHLPLYTGLRKGDCVLVGKQHVKNGLLSTTTEKNGVEVNIPILPQLQRTLDTCPTGDLHFIVGANGLPLNKNTYGNYLRKAANKAGVKGKSCHGLRKTGATRAAEAGATVSELEALFGWTGGGMAELYTKSADRKRLAIAASEKIKNKLSPNLIQEPRTYKKDI